MIARLTGTIVEHEDKAVILDVHGVGYRVRVGTSIREKVHIGDQVTLRIYHQIQEDREELYGFEQAEEEAYFMLLIDVPSVGPKMARNILDVAPPRMLEQAIATEDLTMLTKISGVGKRTAERLIVELKTKVAKPTKAGLPGMVQQEVVEALVSIGYTPTQARQAVSKLPKNIGSVEEAVRAVLQGKNA